MFDPLTIGVGALVWFAFKKNRGTQFGVLTEEREEIYKNAMEYLKDPSRLRQLADDFQKEGLKAQAALMRKRAEWRGRSAELRAKHEEVFQRALKSDNIQGILEIAKIFEEYTATLKAGQLRDRARTLNMSRHTKATEGEKKDNGDESSVDSKAAE